MGRRVLGCFLLGALLVTACAGPVQPSDSKPSGAQRKPVTVLGAGMVNELVTRGLASAVEGSQHRKLNYTQGNSVALANGIKSGELRGDIYMSADADVNKTLMGAANGDHVPWFVIFGGNQVVLAYDPKSEFAADFRSKPWYEVLQEPGVKLGRYDPNKDPLGYYALFVAELAEKYYHVPGLRQRILGADTNPDQMITDDFPDGKSDAAFYYRSGAEWDKTPYVTLPDELNLGNPAMTSRYAGASFTNDNGQTFRGDAIQASIAPLNGGDSRAAAETIRVLLSSQGKQLLRRFHFTTGQVLAGGDQSAIPGAVRQFVQGRYPG